MVRRLLRISCLHPIRGIWRAGALASGVGLGLLLASMAAADWTCYGIADTDPGVCNGHGTCTAPDSCSCDAGYSGADCENEDPVPVPALVPLASALLVLLLVGAGGRSLMRSSCEHR